MGWALAPEVLDLRLFFGIDLEEEIRARISSYIVDLRKRLPDSAAKWTRPEGWHLTLKFIGETKREVEIQKLLSEIKGKPFEIAFRRTGFFTPRSPRVFFVEVHAPPQLATLAASIEDAMTQVGIGKETRAYSPHLTLARFGSGRPQGSPTDRNKQKMYTLKQLLDANPDLTNPDFGTMTAKEFVLFQSTLHPQGSIYTKLVRYPLRANS